MQDTILDLIKTPPESWEHLFEWALPELTHISKKLDVEKKLGPYYPLKSDIFNAFKETKLKDVKVILIEKEPYPQSIILNNKSVPKAQGLSFSVHPQDEIPISLKNIYKELKNSIPSFVEPNHRCLKEWAHQGVLLLNTCLTVTPNLEYSHSKYELWLGFINKVIKTISEVNKNCIVLLWGPNVQKISSIIPNSFVQLTTSYPTGFSANRGFFGCNHFNLVNELLIKQEKTPIDWQITPI